MSFTVIIPARYGSTRLPGKPLLEIAGKPMIQRVWEQACNSSATDVVIATDDDRIVQASDAFGARVLLTSAQHAQGTDRLEEVATVLQLAPDHVVVNVQGDEPLIPPALIDQVAENLRTNVTASIATLCEPIVDLSELLNPNAVKVVFDESGLALYFSRAAIPWPREEFATASTEMPTSCNWYRHIGIYAYRTAFLHEYVTWEPASLEVSEQLEQLRALYHGERIHVDRAVQSVPGGVDTEQDLEAVRAYFEQ
jgi:3-deoxy-manno-octulosonate cytidylyltransferase (CMP-KDO synthetase)